MSTLALRPPPSALRLLVMATGEFAVPTFRLLLDQGYQVRMLITQPDRPQGRHQVLVPAAIKSLAIERSVEVYQPESVNAPEVLERLAALQPDLLVVAAYGQILSDDLLHVPRLGGVNLHASLLPKYRGAAPINWAIYNGEQVTGVTVIRMTPNLDAGAILLQAETPIGSTETAGDLEVRLANLGAPLICESIDGLDAGTLQGRKQDRAQATRAPKLKKEHGLIDWTRSAVRVCDQIRAMQPWPMAYTFLNRVGGASERIIVERAVAEIESPSTSTAPEPGSVSVASGERIVVQAGSGCVRIEALRPAGKRSMPAKEFLRGRQFAQSDRFGQPDESIPGS